MDIESLRLSDLTAEEEATLQGYKSASDTDNGRSRCFDLNRAFEYGLKVKDLEDQLQSVATSLDAIFKRCPVLLNKLTVFRGIGSRMKELASGI